MESANRRISRLAGHVAPCDLTAETLLRQACAASAGLDFEPGNLLKGKVALITGAGQGIGSAAAVLFAQHGAKVVVSDLDGAKADATVDFIRNSGGDAISVAGDVTDLAFPKRVVEATRAKYGDLHILVNNAGFTWDGVIHRMGDKQFDTMLNVHVSAPFRLIREAVPLMRAKAIEELERGPGAAPRSIINISSVSGTHGSAGQVNYAAAKAAVTGMTKSIAREWGQFNIRANTIAFGYIATRLTAPREEGASIKVNGESVKLGIPGAASQAEMAKLMIPMGRLGTPDEAAGAILLIASPYASYISGQTIEVTGAGWI